MIMRERMPSPARHVCLMFMSRRCPTPLFLSQVCAQRLFARRHAALRHDRFYSPAGCRPAPTPPPIDSPDIITPWLSIFYARYASTMRRYARYRHHAHAAAVAATRSTLPPTFQIVLMIFSIISPRDTLCALFTPTSPCPRVSAARERRYQHLMRPR